MLLIVSAGLMSPACSSNEVVDRAETTILDFMRAAEARDFDRVDELSTGSTDFREFIPDNYHFFENWEDIHLSSSKAETVGLPQRLFGVEARGYISGSISYADGHEGSFQAYLVKRGDTWRLHDIRFYLKR
jgi:hypothetical protein